MSLTIGKILGLQRCAGLDGTFTILALDHRGNLKRALNPLDPDSVSYDTVVQFKQVLTATLSSKADGMLLDPVYGAAQVIASRALHPHTGLLVAVEKTGYAGDPTERETQILPGWSVEKIARMGAAAVKLLVYYHPDATNASTQEAILQQVADDCQVHDIPLFLEPLSYSLNPNEKRLPSEEKRQVVIETARRLTPMGVDVLKAEFPLEIAEDSDLDHWQQACQELTAASVVPWVLLSAGVSFEAFKQQTEIACKAGASGVLAGRAVWKEAVDLTGEARLDFLRTTAAERLDELKALVTTYAQPWYNYHPDLGTTVAEGWYLDY